VTAFEERGGRASTCFTHELGEVKLPTALEGRKCKAVAAGDNFSAAIVEVPGEPNVLVTWGQGLHGQLGRVPPKHCAPPSIVKALLNKQEWDENQGALRKLGVQEVACGAEHCVVLLDNGCVMSFGRNENGQLGDGTLATALAPNLVMAVQSLKARHVFAGGNTSAIVT